jgi:hypothetical protein
MDNYDEFGALPQELGLIFGYQSAPDAAQPDLTCEMLYTDYESLVFAQPPVDCDG